MKRLLVVSNQIPINIYKDQEDFRLEPGKEIENSGLQGFYKEFQTIWIGQTLLADHAFTETEIRILEKKLKDFNCIPVFADPYDYNLYLYGFAKNTIWPLFHYLTQDVSYQEEQWEAYKRINQLYADKVMDVIEDGDIIWVHDYHLLLLPQLIREQKQSVSIGLFIHIPFPSFEIFRLLPWRVEILEGVLSADLIGFQTYDYVRHFLSCVQRLMGYDIVFNRISIDEHTLKVDVFPKGIDFNRFHREAGGQKEKSGKPKSKIQEQIESYLIPETDKKLILSAGHLDNTKGIPHRLKAYEIFLETRPEYREKVILILVAAPTGEEGEKYDGLKREVDELVGRINGTYGTINWMPVWYMNQEFTTAELIDLYAVSDIGFIVPLRDGLNLVAKEYVASRPDRTGVLILSEMAGASKELHESILVNPNNLNEMAMAIEEALKMPESEQVRRNTVMQERLKRYNIERWAREFIKGLEGVKEIQETSLTRKITDASINSIASAYGTARNRILFLDYDGTLTWFRKNPEDAKPDSVLYNILKALAYDKKNTLVIISGRDRETLGKWFDSSWKIHLVAEHGVWLREPGLDWYMMEQIDNKWKKTIRPLLEYYVDQTPRTFIENKNFSLVWHYRKADPGLGIQRSWELKDELLSLTSNLNLEIMDGDKVLEIKHSGINKGRATKQKTGNNEFDFIMAIGDDWTDEYTFDALPDSAYTIKVGAKTTKANYYIESVEAVREMLKKLANLSSNQKVIS